MPLLMNNWPPPQTDAVYSTLGLGEVDRVSLWCLGCKLTIKLNKFDSMYGDAVASKSVSTASLGLDSEDLDGGQQRFPLGKDP